MSLFLRFRKDYFNYLISVILPALISGISVPVFKRMLGAYNYGQFALWNNALLIVVSVITGWITQSIIRYYATVPDHKSFFYSALKITKATLFIFSIPVCIAAWLVSDNLFQALLSGALFFMVAIQASLLAVTQSVFLSRKMIYSETLRVISYFSFALFMLGFSKENFISKLLLALLISYTVSSIYLNLQLRKHFTPNLSVETSENTAWKNWIRTFLNYGTPFSFWFVFAFLLTYVDKLFMFHYVGGVAQGNYQSMFDLISRSIAIIISPVVTSIFPLLTNAYEKGERKEAKKLLVKIILYEGGGMLLTLFLFWLFGARLLATILDIPVNNEFYFMGAVVICASFIWQIAILVQKKYELQKRGGTMLLMIVLAFLTQLTFVYCFKHLGNAIIYPLAYLVASMVYVMLLLMPEFKKQFKSNLLQ